MKKIALIILAVATAAGAGYFVYTKSKKIPATDEEMIPASAAHEKTESKTPDMETPMEAPIPAPEAVPAAAEKPKAKTKPTTGHFEMTVPASHDESDAADNPGYGKARENKLWSIFKNDKDLARSIKVKSIHCRVDTCVIEAEAKDGDAERFQSLMYALTKQFPWIGNKVDVTTPQDNPNVARFVYFHETPK